MEFYQVKSLWPEKKGFSLYRPKINDEYIFLHFLTPATLFLSGEYVPVKAGASIFYAPGSCQEFSSNDSELLHDWFHVSSDFSQLMEKYGVFPGKIYYPESAEITEIVREIELECLTSGVHFHDAARLLSEKLLITLSRSALDENPLPQSPGDLHKKQFIYARSHIHMDYKRDWSIDEMAELVHLSASRFFTLYKNIFGVSPKEDLLKSRIQHAEMLLSQGYSVKEVATLSGFSNQYNFIRQFKKLTGQTPGKYKKD
ncbi:MAG: helix-turn-helix transcriptional regulator [Clostridia bacterium]|nr:helix-turn-helix transcriptional regulator [Clostridia bacterium]